MTGRSTVAAGDLGEAARGSRRLALGPCSRTRVERPGVKEDRPSLANCVTGSCFDEEERLLYVYTFLTGRGCIDAYRLK